MNTEDQNQLFFLPVDLVSDDNGNLFILEQGNNRIQKFDKMGSYLKSIGTKGQSPGELNSPISMSINKNNSTLYVADIGNSRINKYKLSGDNLESLKVMEYFQVLRVTSVGNIIGQSYFAFKALKNNYEVGVKSLLSLYSESGQLIKRFGTLEFFENDAYMFYLNRV